MTLGFKQHFPCKGPDCKPEPTYFREKILLGVGMCTGAGNITTVEEWRKLNPGIEPSPMRPKFHTMRHDPHNRWKPGRKIEMVYRGAGYKILDHFNKDIPELGECTGVQKVKITPWTNLNHEQWIFIDNKPLGEPEQYHKFFQNDGFKDGLQFVRWFKKPIELKLIHWTDLRY